MNVQVRTAKNEQRHRKHKATNKQWTMSRNIDETKFSFKAFRNLKKGLGEFDAVVECNEMAIREFLKNLKA